MRVKTFKYRIYPTKGQIRILNSQLDSCCWLYNYFLNQKIELYKDNKQKISMYDQQNQLKPLKEQYPELKNISSMVLCDIAQRIDLAFKAFFRRYKKGEEPGYPRFKNQNRYDSMTFKTYGNGIKIISKNKIRILNIGHIKTVFHRPIEGKIKTTTIKKSSTGKWYIIFNCEVVDSIPLPKSELNIGIDVGLTTFAYLSDDTKIDNPRFFKKEEKNLKKIQRKLDKVSIKDKSNKVLNFKDKKRIKAKKVLSRVHERIIFKRHDFSHQESRKIINKYQIICIEDLNINKLVQKNHKPIRKSISDANWSKFFDLLFYKAEEAGRTVIAVNPAYTSQDCSSCGYRNKKLLSDRIYSCSNCDLIINRDLNASLNILRIGLDSLGVKS